MGFVFILGILLKIIGIVLCNGFNSKKACFLDLILLQIKENIYKHTHRGIYIHISVDTHILVATLADLGHVIGLCI